MTCPICGFWRVVELPARDGHINGACDHCGKAWTRRVFEDVPVVRTVDGTVLFTYSSPQEQEPERREQPVLRSRAYITPSGITFTLDLAWENRPPDATAWQDRIGRQLPDGTVEWKDIGSVQVIGSQPPTPICPRCAFDLFVERNIGNDYGPHHLGWKCTECSVSFKVRRGELAATVEGGLPAPVEDRAALGGTPMAPEAILALKTAAGVPATDDELAVVLARAAADAAEQQWERTLARFRLQRTLLFCTSMGLALAAFLLAALAIWSTSLSLQFAMTGLLFGLTSIGTTYVSRKHHHRPVRAA